MEILHIHIVGTIRVNKAINTHHDFFKERRNSEYIMKKD
jgi:hypothetical protein